MGLREYRRKRNFKLTPEPSGDRATPASARQFVVQKHDASRLHYDFRLELDGTLKSWAVPKGPSLDPAVKSLAVHVEDHPLAYAAFEGVIPQGEYGGGTVMVWDRGDWEPEGGDPAKAYRDGKLKFRLNGEKLHGSWALVRMGGRAGDDGKNWLLIKHKDSDSKSTNKYDVVKKEPLSVASGRDLPAIAADADSVWSSKGRAAAISSKAPPKTRTTKKTPKSKSRRSKTAVASDIGNVTGARKAAQPNAMKPQLATLAQDVPEGENWFHELKFDGYRILAFLKNGRVRLVTRNGNDWTHRFPTVAAAVSELSASQAILDGEIVSPNEHGISDFQQLQNALKRGDDASLVCYAFDLPYCEGYDLTAAPLSERKSALGDLILGINPDNDGTLRYSDHVTGQGAEVLDQACRSAMEGIVSKQADAPYEHGRSRSWLKVKCTKRQEFVVCGYTKPTGARSGFGALVVGYHKKGRLTYSGRVGTGFTDASLRQLAKELKSRRTADAPFDEALTSAQRRGVTWVRPELVAEVEFTEWTDEGLLRHPSFKGLREDKAPKQITREEALPMSRASRSASSGASEVAGVTITHPDRVVYPEAGVTKKDLAEYYAAVADWVLPHVVGRPLTLVRCPSGRTGQCFYQKHLAESLSEFIRSVPIKEKDGTDEYVVIDDLPGLISLVQMGVMELHPWPARADKVDAPDRIVFDLDPGEGVPWKSVVEAARDVRTRICELGLECFLRTSGGKGLHVVVPLARRNSWEELKAFAKSVAEGMVRSAPKRYIATMSMAKRRGKLFVDYLRNQRGSTAIASYSTRARSGAPVAAPLAWHELTTRTKADGYTVLNMPRRLATLKADPWDGFFRVRQSITQKIQAALA